MNSRPKSAAILPGDKSMPYPNAWRFCSIARWHSRSDSVTTSKNVIPSIDPAAKQSSYHDLTVKNTLPPLGSVYIMDWLLQ